MSYGPLADRTAFLGWLEERQASRILSIMPVVDRRACRRLGNLGGDPAGHADVEVGHIVRVRSLQRTPLATEAQYLLRAMSRDAGISALRMKCNALNAASYRAALRFRLRLRRAFSQPHDQQGPQPRQRLVRDDRYGLAGPQGRLRALAGARHFDAAGRQRTSLRELNRVA